MFFLGKNKKFSNEFYNFAIKIGALNNKADEKAIFRTEIETLKAYLVGGKVIPAYQAEYVVRLIFCFTFGYDVNFSKIYTINHTKSKTLLVKKLGYIACGMFFSEDDEKRLLIIGSLQQDLTSSNLIESETALVHIDKLITPSFMSAIMHQVRHMAIGGPNIAPTKEAKALNAYYRCYELDPIACRDALDIIHSKLDIFKYNSTTPHGDTLKGNLESSLMAISIINKHLAKKRELGPFNNILPQLVRFLAAAVDRMLPKQWGYHLNPAPWHQQMVLKIITRLSIVDLDFQTTVEDIPKSTGLNITLSDLFVSLINFHDDGLNLGKGLVVETFMTAYETNLMDTAELNEMAIKYAHQFIGSNNNIIRLVGFSLISKIGPSMDTFKIIVNFIFSEDESVAEEAFKTAKFIATEDTVKILVDYMLPAIQKNKSNIRASLVKEFISICEMYCPDHSYFVEKTIKVIQNFSTYLNIELLDKYVGTILTFNKTFETSLEFTIKHLEDELDKGFESNNINIGIIYIYLSLSLYLRSYRQEAREELVAKIYDFILAHFNTNSCEAQIIRNLIMNLNVDVKLVLEVLENEEFEEMFTFENCLEYQKFQSNDSDKKEEKNESENENDNEEKSDDKENKEEDEECYEPAFLNEDNLDTTRATSTLKFDAYQPTFVRQRRNSSASYITKTKLDVEEEVEPKTNIFNLEDEEAKKTQKENENEIFGRLKKGRWKKRIEAKKTIDMFKAKTDDSDMFAGLSTTKKRNNTVELKNEEIKEQYKGIKIFKTFNDELLLIKTFVSGNIVYLKIRGKEKEMVFVIEGDNERIKEITLESSDEDQNADVTNMFAMEEEDNCDEEPERPRIEINSKLDKDTVVKIHTVNENIEEGDEVVIKSGNEEHEIKIQLFGN